MEQHAIECYKKAGKIAAKVRAYASNLIKAGMRAEELADMLEKKIVELGGQLAFQATININDVAAHYAPVLNDPLTIKQDDYVKIDLGVHIDGYIADTAITIRPAGKDELIICSEKMLETAIRMFKPDVVLEDIAAAVEDVAKEFGFKPVANLTGHSIERWTVHAGINVPSVRCRAPKVLSVGEVYGVEPFVTTGRGLVKESPPATIFRCISDKPVRSSLSRKILNIAINEWKMLPFAKRWVQRRFRENVDMALKGLVKIGALYPYNTLKEVSGSPVAQAEHTVIVAEKPIVITL